MVASVALSERGRRLSTFQTKRCESVSSVVATPLLRIVPTKRRVVVPDLT